MSNILKHIKERFGQGTSKAKLQKESFLMEQRKTESINQFARWVEQRFKRLRALYPGRCDRGPIERKSLPGNASTFERFSEISLYEGGGRI